MPSSGFQTSALRSEEHTSELQSHDNLVWRLLLEKKKGPWSAEGSTAMGRTGSILAPRRPLRPQRPTVRRPLEVTCALSHSSSFFFNDTATPETSPLPLPAALPI